MCYAGVHLYIHVYLSLSISLPIVIEGKSFYKGSRRHVLLCPVGGCGKLFHTGTIKLRVKSPFGRIVCIWYVLARNASLDTLQLVAFGSQWEMYCLACHGCQLEMAPRAPAPIRTCQVWRTPRKELLFPLNGGVPCRCLMRIFWSSNLIGCGSWSCGGWGILNTWFRSSTIKERWSLELWSRSSSLNAWMSWSSINASNWTDANRTERGASWWQWHSIAFVEGRSTCCGIIVQLVVVKPHASNVVLR